MEKGLTQWEMAKILGISQQAFSTYEIDFCEPKYDMLKMMAILLNVSVEWLISGEKQA